ASLKIFFMYFFGKPFLSLTMMYLYWLPCPNKICQGQQVRTPSKNQSEHYGCFCQRQLNKMCVPLYQSVTIQMREHCNCHKSVHSHLDTSPKQIPSTIRQLLFCRRQTVSEISTAPLFVPCSH